MLKKELSSEQHDALEKVQNVISTIQEFKEKITEVLSLSETLSEIQNNTKIKDDMTDDTYKKALVLLKKIEGFKKNIERKKNIELHTIHTTLKNTVLNMITSLENIHISHEHISQSDINMLRKKL